MLELCYIHSYKNTFLLKISDSNTQHLTSLSNMKDNIIEKLWNKVKWYSFTIIFSWP